MKTKKYEKITLYVATETYQNNPQDSTLSALDFIVEEFMGNLEVIILDYDSKDMQLVMMEEEWHQHLEVIQTLTKLLTT